MIYLKISGHDFNYEIEDIIRLFFKDEEVKLIDNIPPENERGIFIFCSVDSIEKGNEVRSVLICNGKKLIEDSKIYANPKTPENNKKNLKHEMKRQVYLLLERHTGFSQPWGMLTGIRPGKIVHEMFSKGMDKRSILRRLTDYYLVSQEKAELIHRIATTEKEILDKSGSNMVSVYIGIPFCPTRCLYCSFISSPIDKYRKIVDKYLEALKYEITKAKEIINEKGLKIQSLYIGGGTPTAIDAIQLKDLLSHIEDEFDFSCLEEYTIEAGRPDSIDEEKLRAIKESRTDRISINPQSMNDETLRLIGRDHSALEVVKAFKLARKMGFENINMDVIIGLPGENSEMFENTLRKISELGPESVTVHTMAIKRASKLNEDKEKYSFISSDEANKMITISKRYADKMGMQPYYLYRQKNVLGNLENVGYCRPGKESIYNIQIMEEKQTIIALGAGGITKVVYPQEKRIERAFNVKNVEQYIERLDEMLERKKALIYV